jgi:MarR family transcriptional regulator, organic hydroperoxide resistance regulator
MPLPRDAKVAVLRAADGVRRRMVEVLAPAGITLQQYNVLRILRGARPEPLPTLEIAERMIERTPGITRLLDGLVRKGLVERQRSDADRRTVLCRITASGLELLSELDAPVERSDQGAVARLSEAEQATLVALLTRII